VGTATLGTITTRLQMCPNMLHKHPMYVIKVAVRRALTSRRIPVPFFLNETLNPHCHVNLMHKPFTKNCQMKKINLLHASQHYSSHSLQQLLALTSGA